MKTLLKILLACLGLFLVLGVGAYNTLVYVGLQSTTAVNATVLSPSSRW